MSNKSKKKKGGGGSGDQPQLGTSNSKSESGSQALNGLTHIKLRALQSSSGFDYVRKEGTH
jgi:hypothetical protein